MDNRKGDRHRHKYSARSHKSGAAKKRERELARAKDEAETAKLTKISGFLEVRPQLIEQSSNVAGPSGIAVGVAEANPAPDEPMGTESETSQSSDDALEQAADDFAIAAPPPVIAPAWVCPPEWNDIGLWPAVISNEMREYWVKKGPSSIQSCDEQLFDHHSVQQPRNDTPSPRVCSIGLFKPKSPNKETRSRNWLCFSPSTGSLYCFRCKLMCSDTSRSNASLISDGFSDWKHAQERLGEHERSSEHQNAVIAFSRRLKLTGRIDVDLALQVEKLNNYWKLVLRRAISVIKFIAERGLAFRGDNELIGSPKNGNYLGILELISEYDCFLAEHIQTHANRGSGHANYLSSTIMEEIVAIMGDRVLHEIISRVKRAKYYSISLDSTPDESHVDQLTLIFRYVEHGEPVERFVTFMDNRGHKAQDMFNALIDFMRWHEIDLANCRGQSYDNASAMSGIYNGLQAKVIEENDKAAWIPCTAHSLNLVGKNAAECCASAANFFDFVERLFVFFTASTNRHKILTTALREADASLTLKRVTTTRWSSRADATKALRKGYSQIRTALDGIADDEEEKGCVRSEAEGLLSRINQLETGIYTVFWDEILQRADATNKSLQAVKLDLNSAVAALSSLKDYVASKRNSFDEYRVEGEGLSGSTEYVQAKQRHRTRNVRLTPLDYGNAPEVQLTPADRYRTESFIPVIEQFTACLEQRLKAYKLMSSRFGFFRNMTKLSTAELRAVASALVKAYPDDLDDLFSEEIVQFVAFANIFSDEEPDDSSKELFLYKLLFSKGVEDTFPNVEIALRMYLTLMVTNCSGERSFSKLKLIENRLRTSMKQERLVNLTIMSLEADITRKLDCSDLVADFATQKSRKVPGL